MPGVRLTNTGPRLLHQGRSLHGRLGDAVPGERERHDRLQANQEERLPSDQRGAGANRGREPLLQIRTPGIRQPCSTGDELTSADARGRKRRLGDGEEQQQA